MGQVAVIDEDEDWCTVLCTLINAHGAEATPYAKAASYIADPLFNAAHVAVIALGQQTFNGLDLVKLAIERSQASHVFAVVEALNLQEIVTAVKVGAADVLQKPISVDSIIKCARGTDPLLLSGLPNTLCDQSQKLSRREQQVLKALLQGATNAAIAEKLTISIRTVETHRSKIYSKLGVKNHAGLLHALRT